MMKSFKGQIGQTLLELVVVVGVATIMIGAMVLLSNSTTRRANDARAYTEASKLAQDGMEIIKHISEIDDQNAVRVSSYCPGGSTPCKFSQMFQVNIGSGNAQRKLIPPGISPCPAGTKSYCMVDGVEQINLGTASFNRWFYIQDDNLSGGVCASSLDWQDMKRITVEVSWNSPRGTQNRKVVSCISKHLR